MNVRLISHVNRDDDLIEAWLRHYLRLGVASFHLIAHGGREQNQRLFEIADRYPVHILDTYTGVFDPFEKRDRLAWGLSTLGSGWVVLVDNDEFLELPYRSLSTTVNMMRWLRADALRAPMLQRFAWDGIYVEGGARPFDAYPWCSVDLYARLGQPQSVIDKYPVFELQRHTRLNSGGNHYPPNGYGSRLAPMLGVTHHFKWRPAVQNRSSERASSTDAYRGESQHYIKFLGESGWRLPTDSTFRYSRRALFIRGLLRRPTAADLIQRRAPIVETPNGPNSVFDVVTSPERLAARPRVTS
jgi:Glycosyl transferase family 2